MPGLTEESKRVSPSPRILVVEDDPQLVVALGLALSKEYQTLFATDSFEAEVLLEENEVDLILLDMILPKGTGVHVLEYLQERPAPPPVIVMSAISRQLDLSPYGRFVSATLAKPFNLATIHRTVQEALGGHRLTSDRTLESRRTVLLVDDDPDLLESMRLNLEQSGYQVRTASSGRDALAILAAERFDVAAVDWIMPGFSGLDLLARVKSILPELPVLLMSGHGTLSLLHSAMEAGADDVLTKPFPPQALVMALEKCMGASTRAAGAPAPAGLTRERRSGTGPVRYDLTSIRGISPAIERARQALLQAAVTDANVLILGATGTGKELFAQAVHRCSPRADGPFVVVNSAAIPDTLLEAELFGYEGGAFTGARKEGRVGKFMQAHRGTLFLDEIGDLPLSLQAKLLRVLQEREVEVVGGRTRPVDVRVVAASHRDLQAMVRKGTFRGDLFYRLNVVSLSLPALQERKQDIPELAQHFLAELQERYNRPAIEFSPEAMRLLQEHHWPGNVRELRNTVERAFAFAQGPLILPVHLALNEGAPGAPGVPEEPRPMDMASQEREAIIRALAATGGNKLQAARLLGISRANLYVKLKVYRLQ